MNLIVVGASYRSASVALLEKLSLSPGELPGALSSLLSDAHVAEVAMLSTCNRVELYAAVPAFHAGLTHLVDALAQRTGMTPDELADSLYVHHGADAIDHVFRVASGLDSLVVGEAQILGQLRDAYAAAADAGAAGRLLHELLQQALRVGKRSHAETGIDAAPRNMVTAALELAGGAEGRKALIIGAGAMGGLTAAALTRAGAAEITIVNRDVTKAARLAEAYGATAAGMADLYRLLETAEIVVSATASTGHVLTKSMIKTAAGRRLLTSVEPTVTERRLLTSAEPTAAERRLMTSVEPTVMDHNRSSVMTIIDLAVPRDVEPGVADLPGVDLIDVERMAATLGPQTAEVAAVEAIVEAEVEAFAAWLRGAEVAPTVAALRARADEFVAAELERLGRRADLSGEQRAEVAHAMHRIVQRLLHEPTVRVRQLAAGPDGEAYPRLMRELFGLDLTTDRVDQIPQIVGEA
jgi:glutamyl-tRNA reductase